MKKVAIGTKISIQGLELDINEYKYLNHQKINVSHAIRLIIGKNAYTLLKIIVGKQRQTKCLHSTAYKQYYLIVIHLETDKPFLLILICLLPRECPH